MMKGDFIPSISRNQPVQALSYHGIEQGPLTSFKNALSKPSSRVCTTEDWKRIEGFVIHFLIQGEVGKIRESGKED